MRGARAAVLIAWTVTVAALPGHATELPRAPESAAFSMPDPASVLLGRDLFYDPILSGNRNISCATCHHPATGTSDGRALPLGEGGVGLGPDRAAPARNQPRVIPRNAPALFNLGAREFGVMFHDGRLFRSAQAPHGITLPNGLVLDQPLSPVAAQALMPPVAADEMAGHPGENDVADAVAAGNISGPGGAWEIIADRVAAIPAYRRAFADRLDPGSRIQMSNIAAAIGDFIAFEFRATDSRFDRFLRGDYGVLDAQEQHGLALFYGKANCHVCHAGPFLTDHDFHAIAMPQTGPGKGHGAAKISDHGRSVVTEQPADRYRFRTPSLRNVALTGPYGHSGSYPDLETVIRHHGDPGAGLAGYAFGADDPAMQDEGEVLALYAANELTPIRLKDGEIAALEAFLHTLTDPTPIAGRLGIPARVPSGLPVEISAD